MYVVESVQVGYWWAKVVLEVDDDEGGHDVVMMVVSLEVGLLWERPNLLNTSIAKPLIGRKHLWINCSII